MKIIRQVRLGKNKLQGLLISLDELGDVSQVSKQGKGVSYISNGLGQVRLGQVRVRKEEEFRIHKSNQSQIRLKKVIQVRGQGKEFAMRAMCQVVNVSFLWPLNHFLSRKKKKRKENQVVGAVRSERNQPVIVMSVPPARDPSVGLNEATEGTTTTRPSLLQFETSTAAIPLMGRE